MSVASLAILAAQWPWFEAVEYHWYQSGIVGGKLPDGSPRWIQPPVDGTGVRHVPTTRFITVLGLELVAGVAWLFGPWRFRHD